MHMEGEPFLKLPAEETFPGISLLKEAQDIKALIQLTESRNILDYGSGKGLQYRPQRISFPGVEGEWDSVAEYWDVDNVTCYDPAFAPFSEFPTGTFDGVISTDVLEHCAETDLPWILDELFGLAQRFVYLSVAGHPARKRLPNGENAHCTVQPLHWWRDLVLARSSSRPDVLWTLKYWGDRMQKSVLSYDGKSLHEHLFEGS